MSDNTGDRAYARDADLQPWLAWIGLGMFFLGCGALTVAVVALAGDRTITLVAALIGGPLFVVGLVTLVVTGRFKGEN